MKVVGVGSSPGVLVVNCLPLTVKYYVTTTCLNNRLYLIEKFLSLYFQL